MTEREIVLKIINGDKHLFMEIVDKYKKKIISLCYSYTNDYYEAEDLSQEVFISLYNNLKKFRFDCSLSTYIYKISMSKCMDYKRKHKIKNFMGEVLNGLKSPEEDIIGKNYIRECIDKLPVNLKNPIILYYHIGLNQKEIGQVLEISERAVEGRIYRAKKKLKKELEREEEWLERQMALYR